MNAIQINVNKQMDGYSFSISPSFRDLIKKLFPRAHPANNRDELSSHLKFKYIP